MLIPLCLLSLLSGSLAYVRPRDPVPKDCVFTYSEWSVCSKSCGDGKQSRIATIKQYNTAGGKACPPVTDLRHCNSFPCTPADLPTKTTKKHHTRPTPPVTKRPIVSDATVPPIMCSMLPDGNYPSGKCQRIYFTCASQKLSSLSCPHGLIYDPSNDWCDVPLNTEECTGTKPTPAPTHEVPTHKPDIDAHFNCIDKADGDHPDPELPCSNVYYTCSNGVTSRRHCPANLWFDPELLICDSWQRVPICSGHPRPVDTTPSTIPTHVTTLAPFDCIGKKGNQADPTKPCSHVYYACHAGITDTFLCPEGLYYDASRDLCDLQEFIVACGGHPFVPETTQRSETLEPIHFDCWGKSDGFYSDPDNKCSKIYFACIGMQGRQLHCQEGLIYSASLIACAHPDETWECTGTSPTPHTTLEFIPSTTEAVNFDCSSLNNGYYNNPDQKCSEIYFSCSGGIAHKLTCPVGTFFDPENSWCDFHEDVYECSGQRKTTVITEAATEPTIPVQEYDCSRLSDGLYPFPLINCSQEFFTCSNGYSYKEKCPAHLYFDPQFGVCDSYGNIFACTGQPKRTTTPRTTTVRDDVTTEKLPFDCTGQPDGEYPDPLNKCSATFYVCSNGVTYKQICPPDLFFELNIKVCADFLDVFDCAGKTRPPTTYRPTTPGPILKEVPIDCAVKADGDYPNPTDSCSQIFYTCSNTNGWQRSCPFDLFFDIELGICDSRSVVPACTGHPRLIPVPTTTVSYVTDVSPYDCSIKSTGNYPAGDCEDHFWVCVGGRAARQECPRGLRFDDEFNLCNFGEYMPKCGGVRPEPTTPEHTDAPQEPIIFPVDCSKLPDGNLIDPLSGCSEKFYMCANGFTFEQKCPHGLRYNQEKDECDNLSEIPACAGVIPNSP